MYDFDKKRLEKRLRMLKHEVALGHNRMIPLPKKNDITEGDKKLSKEQKEFLKKEGITYIKTINQVHNWVQYLFISDGGIDYDEYKEILTKLNLMEDEDTTKFTVFQAKEIVEGYGLDVSKYATLDHDSDQMEEVRLGLQKGLNVDLYNRPKKYDWQQMRVIRRGLELDLDVREYLHCRFSEEMEEFMLSQLECRYVELKGELTNQVKKNEELEKRIQELEKGDINMGWNKSKKLEISVKDFEDKVFAKEGVRIVLRVDTAVKVIDYDYIVKAPKNYSLEEFMKKRILPRIPRGIEVEVISGKGALPHMNTSMETVRDTYV